MIMNYYTHKASMATPLTWKEFWIIHTGFFTLGLGPLLLAFLLSSCCPSYDGSKVKQEWESQVIEQCTKEWSDASPFCHFTSWELTEGNKVRFELGRNKLCDGKFGVGKMIPEPWKSSIFLTECKMLGQDSRRDCVVYNMECAIPEADKAPVRTNYGRR